jgi:hypothetical protein
MPFRICNGSADRATAAKVLDRLLLAQSQSWHDALRTQHFAPLTSIRPSSVALRTSDQAVHANTEYVLRIAWRLVLRTKESVDAGIRASADMQRQSTRMGTAAMAAFALFVDHAVGPDIVKAFRCF